MKTMTLLTVILILGLTMFTTQATANDIDVYNVTLQNTQGSGASTSVDIKFDLTWKNSYSGTDGNGASYWDRAWVFVKYIKASNIGTNIAWKHATLYKAGTSGTTLGAYSTTNGIGVSSDQKGVFCKTGMNQIIRWNIGVDESGVASTDTYKVRVFAIEMALVPTGGFYIGDGSTSGNGIGGQFCVANSATTPFNITSENAISLGGSTSANLGNNNLQASPDSSNGITPDDFTNSYVPTTSPVNIPNAFPKGFNGFYIMKYELSQGSYCDFLNTLTREQQQSRIATSIAPAATSVTNIYVMANASAAAYRNTIVCPAALIASLPIAFSTVTPHRACNYIMWPDLCAYADWAGLRPMTELEFEKACRGGSPTNNTVVGEYAWGTINITKATTLSNDGTPNEGVTNTGNGLCSYANASNIYGPLRSGFAATSSTNRVTSGASYYGVMDLSGNLYELVVTVGNANGRVFDGKHGDGYLNTDGNANDDNSTNKSLQYWPGYANGAITNHAGSGRRGATYFFGYLVARTSDRYYVNQPGYRISGDFDSGIRCVRTE